MVTPFFRLSTTSFFRKSSLSVSQNRLFRLTSPKMQLFFNTLIINIVSFYERDYFKRLVIFLPRRNIF